MTNIQNENGLDSQVAIVMVPFPAQGHLVQLLHLSHILAAYNLPIHYVGTTTHIRQAKTRIHGSNPLSISKIQFHEFETPPFVSPPPDPTRPTAFPAHLQPAFDATSHLRAPMGDLLRAMSANTRRVVVIHDKLMASVVQDVATVPNAESYNFVTTSAFCSCWFFVQLLGKNLPIADEIAKELPPSLEGCSTQEFLEFVATQELFSHLKSGSLYNTCRSIEGEYIDLFIKEELNGNTKHWAIGPFNPVAMNQNPNQIQERHICLNFLDHQPVNSVIFVSFGTTISFTDEQINEIAIGLETSEQRFIWVLRDADKGDIFDENVRRVNLPIGYEDRIKGRGIVVRDWAPQLEILAHSATGAFMSHCGWNSCIESISCGVPIATWPMHSDQPANAVLVTKVLKIGVVVKDWASRNEVVMASTVERGVRRLMAETEGDEMRTRASELSKAVRKAVAEGGVSKMELDSFVAHITRYNFHEIL